MSEKEELSSSERDASKNSYTKRPKPPAGVPYRSMEGTLAYHDGKEEGKPRTILELTNRDTGVVANRGKDKESSDTTSSSIKPTALISGAVKSIRSSLKVMFVSSKKATTAAEDPQKGSTIFEGKLSASVLQQHDQHMSRLSNSSGAEPSPLASSGDNDEQQGTVGPPQQAATDREREEQA